MEDVPPGHTLDDDGDHDPEGCYECLLKEEVKCECQCGKCCSLLVEVGIEDANREPRIAERCSPILSAPELSANGERVLIGYLLNTRDDYACVFLEKVSNRCTIYETRPLACRLFDCDHEGREQLIELGIIERGK